VVSTPSSTPTVVAPSATESAVPASADTASANSAPAAAAPARRAASRPPRNSKAFTTTVDGDPELTLLVGTWVDSALTGAGFELVRSRDAGFEVLAIAKVVGSRELFYAGRVELQYTAALTLEASDPATGAELAGPFSTTAQFTSINLERNLKQATEELARKLSEALQARLASGG
jgi:hypothetical protein